MTNRAMNGDSSRSLLVSVVIPVHKNVTTLHELHGGLSRTFLDLDVHCEMIYVDDACPEGSLGVLQELIHSDPRVGVIVLDRNVGQQRALMIGLRFAHGDQIITMDADLQDPPSAIPAMLEMLDSGSAAVFAGRRGRYQSSLRMLFSRIFKTLLHTIVGVPRDAGAFVAMNRAMIDKLLNFHVEKPFIVSLIGFSGLPVTSIPVPRSRRPSGKSAYSSLDRLRTGIDTLCMACYWKWKPDRLYGNNSQNTVAIKAMLGSRFTTLAG